MRLVLISDTHGLHDHMTFSNNKLPEGDILIHAGDMCNSGQYIEEVTGYAYWLQNHAKNYKHILQIAGNHDFQFERTGLLARSILSQVSNLTYLQDAEVVIDGIKFYGTPWQPRFFDWAFNIDRGSEHIKSVWEMIPDDTNVLISHGPPKGFLDLPHRSKEHVGCEDLLNRVNAIKPKLHVFGHIHEGYGKLQMDDIMFVNASTCTANYKPINAPIVFDL